jgi:hypothetical protein
VEYQYQPDPRSYPEPDPRIYPVPDPRIYPVPDPRIYPVPGLFLLKHNFIENQIRL